MSFSPRDIHSLDARHKSDSFQVLNSDSSFLRFEREGARRGVVVKTIALLIIVAIACAAKFLSVI
jgi:hypothetical protein